MCTCEDELFISSRLEEKLSPRNHLIIQVCVIDGTSLGALTKFGLMMSKTKKISNICPNLILQNVVIHKCEEKI